MKPSRQVPPRSKIRPADTWELSSLFPDDRAWERAFARWEKRIAGYEQFRGKLGRDAGTLAECLKFDRDFERLGERLGVYAFLKTAEDGTRSDSQRMLGRYQHAATRAAEAASYIQPEILALPSKRLRQLIASPRLRRFRLLLERLWREKPHTLGRKEERLLAMQMEMAQAPGRIFRQLVDADMRFGTVKNEKGETVELSHASFSTLLHSPDRKVRRTAFHRYYDQIAAHQHTLAAALAGSIQRDIYYARARRFPSALAAALFPDQVPQEVYDGLIETVHRHFPALHAYYDLRRRKMRLRRLHHYDTYVPILASLQRRHTWNQAVDTVIAALEPLGAEYCDTLERGLRGRWCDRYENRGKQSGAFSCSAYDGHPYILMNYQPEVLEHVFTLAHEAGHAMHSYLSARKQPYQYYRYSIFVAEVASTFNEQLLTHYLLQRARDDHQRAFLINRQIDAMRGTIFRQTMFAEFEKLAHQSAEAGEPLTLDRFKEIYHGLLEQYFGPGFALDEQLDLECLRIPHFYQAFYVYKYATGMCAAMALAERVLQGGRAEREAYLRFLSAGCTKDPLDLLRDAGVDLKRPEAIETAMGRFARLVEELDRLI